MKYLSLILLVVFGTYTYAQRKYLAGITQPLQKPVYIGPRDVLPFEKIP